MSGQDIVLKIGANLDAFKVGLADVSKQTNALGTDKWQQFKQAFTVAAIIEGLRELGESMVNLRRSAEDKGTSTDFLQGMQKATVKFGGTAEDADTAIDKLLIKIGEAREQGGAAAEGFTRFGIALKTVDGYATTTEEVFKQIADRYKEAEDPAKRAAIANEFFAKSGLRINNVLEMGGQGLTDYIAKMKEAGKIIEAEKVNALADAYQNLAAAQKTVSGSTAIAAGSVAKFIADAAQMLGALSAGVSIEEAAKAALDVDKLGTDDEKKRAMLDQSRKNLEEMAKLAKEYATAMRGVQQGAGQFAVNDAVKMELALRMKLASLRDGDVQKTKVQGDLEKAIGNRFAAELELKQNSLRELSDSAGELEQEVRAMGYSDDVKIEKEKKKVELANKLKEIASITNEIEQKKLDVLEAQAAAQARVTSAKDALANAKGERTKFTLAELAGANLRGISDPTLREDILKAREVQQLEARAQFLRNRGREGDIAEAAKTFSLADSVRGGISSATEGDRFPFKSLEDGVKESAKQLAEINAKTGQPPKFGAFK